MRLKNISGNVRYSPLFGTTVNPGGTTRDLPVLVEAIDKVMSATRGFAVELSPADVACVSRLYERLVAPLLHGARIPDAPEGAARDPDGSKRNEERLVARRKARQEADARKLGAYREKEARIQAESNYLDESGNPVNDRLTASAAAQDVEPVRHEEMSTDLKSVLENNLAVMRSASGQPIVDPRAVVVPKGGTPVSSDPKDYQNRKHTLPPGMPDFPGAEALVKNVARSQAELERTRNLGGANP